MSTGRCTEVMTALGHPLGCTLPHGHQGQHHDHATGAHWHEGSDRSWRNVWRRQRGGMGFVVEWVMWCTVARAVLLLVELVIRWVTP
jgi:hypothetical protein